MLSLRNEPGNARPSDNGKSCYAVVSDCRASEGYRVRIVIGPLIDAHQLPEEDRSAHDVRYVQTNGFDVVDYVETPPPGHEPVATLAKESIWEQSKRIADAERARWAAP